jgi:hypothetical protein
MRANTNGRVNAHLFFIILVNGPDMQLPQRRYAFRLSLTKEMLQKEGVRVYATH